MYMTCLIWLGLIISCETPRLLEVGLVPNHGDHEEENESKADGGAAYTMDGGRIGADPQAPAASGSQEADKQEQKYGRDYEQRAQIFEGGHLHILRQERGNWQYGEDDEEDEDGVIGAGRIRHGISLEMLYLPTCLPKPLDQSSSPCVAEAGRKSY